ncbi:transporter substrate-binding domain-containing protein [Marinobacter sp. CHS3-4]|uniref:substrate-binding periplasmic protein n=1 Tax=Marinobacter sp. CHS3-4 TaxID=3045174 RepID=UPI0024B56864|nr:transporter substrate-binding domain-containing protein [Marinobacter sp. CHS3-4]MDI9244720.1 transporter substrate-binding domain-containing protein [Marinobacter sp. CHS3-4]
MTSLRAVLVLLGLFLFTAQTIADSAIVVGYGDAYEPFAWVEEGQVRGIQVDFVEAVLVERMGLKVRHEGCPWNRCQREVRKGEKDAFFTVPTAEREEYTLKSLFPFYVTRFVMHTSRENRFRDQLSEVRTLEELESMTELRHVHMLGSGWHESALANMEHVQTSHGADMIPILLARDRADVYIEQAEMFRYQARQKGVLDEVISFDQFAAGALGWHLFIGRDSKHADVMSRIDLVLAEMTASGELQTLKRQIFAKYGVE